MDDLKENMGTVETTAASKHDFDYWSGLILQVLSEDIFSDFIGAFPRHFPIISFSMTVFNIHKLPLLIFHHVAGGAIAVLPLAGQQGSHGYIRHVLDNL